MANNRETKRERREASKRARVEAERKAAKQRRKNRLYAVVAVLAVGGIIAGIIMKGNKPPINKTQLNAAAVAAGCDALVEPPDQGRGHFDQANQTFPYNSNPPTSGKHYSISGVAPAPTSVHNSPIQNEFQVHNLEHGHIGIQYSTAISAEIRDALEEFTRSHPTYIFMAPKPDMPSGVVVAFTAWRNIISCKSPTSVAAVDDLAQKFFDSFQGRGPEGAIAGTPLP